MSVGNPADREIRYSVPAESSTPICLLCSVANIYAAGQQEFQDHPQISQLYTQSAGFAHFLMHYEEGLYRDDLTTLLSAIYRPDDYALNEPSLPEIAGVSYDELDRQYH